MILLTAIEYNDAHNYSITAVDFNKVTWKGNKIIDWEYQRYNDLFFIWARKDLIKFKHLNIDPNNFKSRYYNTAHRQYADLPYYDLLEWAGARRIWFYVCSFDFSLLNKKGWTPVVYGT